MFLPKASPQTGTYFLATFDPELKPNKVLYDLFLLKVLPPQLKILTNFGHEILPKCVLFIIYFNYERGF